MPLVEYLTRELGTEVKLQVSKDYESHITLTGSNSLDIAYLGPSSYVSVVKQYGKKPILGRLEITGKPFFFGYIITHKNSPIQSLHDLPGRRFAFTSSGSTMGYRVPKYMLQQAGIKLEQLGEQRFLGNHENVALGVLVGDFDAGAVKEEIFLRYQNRGLRMLGRSEPISEHVFVCSTKLKQQEIQRIKRALYALKDIPGGLQILQSIKSTVTNIVPGTDRDYNSLRKIMN